MSEIQMRAADADRDRVAERLRTAAGEGRLAPEELEQRLESALTARSYAELQAVVADLPETRRDRRPGRAPELRAFLATSVLLLAIWALTGMGYFWPVWPILGWGLFVVPGVRRAARVRPCRPGSSRPAF